MTDFSEKDFDVISFAKKIMSEVESIRSFTKTKDEKTGEGFQLPTETRINAFFRLIGFPMFVSIKGKDVESTFLHPGFGASIRSKLADKTIENSNESYFYGDGTEEPISKVLSDRTQNLQKISNEMGNKDMNIKISKAMYAPLEIVPNFPDKAMGDADYIPKIPPLGGNDTENKRKVFKKLFPLIPSADDPETSVGPYRVLPLRNEIARPFTLDVKERRVDNNTVLRKPFIEQVIRIRFLKFGSSETEKQRELEKDISNSIKQLLGDETYSEIFKDEKIFSKVSVLEEFVINKFFNAIKSLAKRWGRINESRIKLLRQIRPVINIKTNSSKTSRFGKMVDLSVDLDGTEEGEKLKILNEMISKEEGLMALLPSDEDETTNVKQSGTRNVSPIALQNPFVDLLTYNLQKNKEARTSVQSKLKRDIRNLEKIRLEVVDLMTGEFTGLSLPDIIMVIAALFVVDKQQLLNILDKYTIDFMKKDPVFKEIVKNINPTAEKAMEGIELIEEAVLQMFKIFDRELDLVNNRKKRGQEGNTQSVYKSPANKRKDSCVVYKEET